MNSKSIIIISAGVAGLSTGCYTQMNSYNSKIFEMHSLLGGVYSARSSGGSSSGGSSGGSVIGNRSSKIYHKSSCQWAQKISSSNRVYFSTEADAIKAGYRACKVCKP